MGRVTPADRWDHPRVRGEEGTHTAGSNTSKGSPPRARGAGHHHRHADRRHRITPACAGSRSPSPARRPAAPDHPRVRGEQDGWSGLSLVGRGSPLRARGADRKGPPGDRRVRITPACAGSRRCRGLLARLRPDHPRVRGEQTVYASPRMVVEGSPPRARGEAGGGGLHGDPRRITPACAGSSHRMVTPKMSNPDHPPVRGEQGVGAAGVGGELGSPPRARGAGRPATTEPARRRITPACAGSRAATTRRRTETEDHPRVRGEQVFLDLQRAAGEGSPPRARGAGLRRPGRRPGQRITPACAGSRLDGVAFSVMTGDHPRVRGEQIGCDFSREGVGGSPPRARGAAA